jgi:hypothetical protein
VGVSQRSPNHVGPVQQAVSDLVRVQVLIPAAWGLSYLSSSSCLLYARPAFVFPFPVRPLSSRILRVASLLVAVLGLRVCAP